MALPRFLPAALGVVSLCAFGTAGAITPDQHPTVTHASRHDVSAPMRDIVRNMPPEAPLGTEQEPFLIPNILLKPSGIANRKPYLPGIQSAPIDVPAPAIDLSWEGVSSATSGCGCLPPDTEGDVSDQHYIQWVNTRWAVYDKTDGSVVQGPTNGNSFFVGFGGKCETTNAGDPITLWDPRAQRWIMSQFVTSAPFAQCVAVSTTSDPLGTYNRYEFDWTNFGDYPKLAVWTDDSGGQDAYLLTTHEFQGQAFQGAALIALERDAMVAGDPSPAMVHFGGYDAYGVEPINLVGQMNAPANACGGYTHFDAGTSDYLFWDICLDWTTPANTTISANPTRVPGTPFVPYFDEVPQQGSPNGLDPFGTHIMYRANARAFPADAPTRISLVVNHVVQGDCRSRAASTGSTSISTTTARHSRCRHRSTRRCSRKASTRPTATTAGWAASRSTAAATSASASRSRARSSIRRSRSRAARPRIRRARSRTSRTAPTASATARRPARAIAGAITRR